MKIVFVANTSWYLYNFRVPLMNALKVMGHTVYAAAPKDAYSEKLEKLGIIFCEWHIGRTNVNPLTELFALFELQKILQHNKVDLALSYTPKGNIHTSISCMFSRKKVINKETAIKKVYELYSTSSLFITKDLIDHIIKSINTFRK